MTYTAQVLVKLAAGKGELAKAAAYALELMEYSEKGEKGEPLDLQMATYDFAAIPLMMAGVSALREGKEREAVRSELALRAASYELFTLCNFLNSTGEVDCKIDSNLALSPYPVLVAAEKAGGKPICFDLFGVFEKTKNDCFLFPAEGVAVDVSPARALIQEQLFEKL